MCDNSKLSGRAMPKLKNALWTLVADRWPGSMFRLLEGWLRPRPFVFGLRNPLHMRHVVTEQAGGVYLSDRDNYIAVGHAVRRLVEVDPELFEEEIVYLMRALIRPDDVVLDIGANIGFHTVTMAKVAHRGRVYAFEPVREMAEQNSTNCALNRLDNVVIVPVALGSAPATLKMKVNVGGEGLQGTSTFIQYNHNVDSNPKCYVAREVQVVRLDDIVDRLGMPGRIGFVKIDTEGFDTHVIDGGLATFRKHRPIMIVEAHSDRLAEAGRSWSWFLEAFPDYHILVSHSVTRAKPYLHLEPLGPDEPRIAVNLLLLPRTRELRL